MESASRSHSWECQRQEFDRKFYKDLNELKIRFGIPVDHHFDWQGDPSKILSPYVENRWGSPSSRGQIQVVLDRIQDFRTNMHNQFNELRQCFRRESKDLDEMLRPSDRSEMQFDVPSSQQHESSSQRSEDESLADAQMCSSMDAHEGGDTLPYISDLNSFAESDSIEPDHYHMLENQEEGDTPRLWTLGVDLSSQELVSLDMKVQDTVGDSKDQTIFYGSTEVTSNSMTNFTCCCNG